MTPELSLPHHTVKGMDKHSGPGKGSEILTIVVVFLVVVTLKRRHNNNSFLIIKITDTLHKHIEVISTSRMKITLQRIRTTRDNLYEPFDNCPEKLSSTWQGFVSVLLTAVFQGPGIMLGPHSKSSINIC